MENIDARNAETGNINTVSSILSKFRMNCKAFFLTYPRCPITIDDMINNLKDKNCIERYYVARELHNDKSEETKCPYHLHVLLKYGYKRNITSQDYFDILGFHPNVQAVKNWTNSVNYVCKDGDFKSNVNFSCAEPEGFVRRKKDFDAWNEYINRPVFKDIKYPFELFGKNIFKPEPKNKCRHYWFHGTFDLGKTKMIEDAFEGMKIYKRPKNNKYPFENYNDEDIIVYDDVKKITFEEISDVCNTYKTQTPVFGDVRYVNKYWKINHCRLVIIITNESPKYGEYQKGIEGRFNIISLDMEHMLKLGLEIATKNC